MKKQAKQKRAQRKSIKVKTKVRAGGNGRRLELDHVGAYNFTVEIETISL